MNKIAQGKYNKLLVYILLGGIATVINILTFGLCLYLNMGLVYANTIAFVFSVLFSYITNSKYVFRVGQQVHKNKLIIEGIIFFTSRVATLGIDTIGIYMLHLMGFTEMIGKVLMCFIILILNYIISQFIIFKK